MSNTAVTKANFVIDGTSSSITIANLKRYFKDNLKIFRYFNSMLDGLEPIQHVKAMSEKLGNQVTPELLGRFLQEQLDNDAVVEQSLRALLQKDFLLKVENSKFYNENYLINGVQAPHARPYEFYQAIMEEHESSEARDLWDDYWNASNAINSDSMKQLAEKLCRCRYHLLSVRAKGLR